jgi:hypothetical protein
MPLFGRGTSVVDRCWCMHSEEDSCVNSHGGNIVLGKKLGGILGLQEGRLSDEGFKQSRLPSSLTLVLARI